MTGVSGSGSDAEQVEAVVLEYLRGVADADYERACALLSPGVKRDLAAFARDHFPELDAEDCAAVVERLLLDADHDQLRRLLEDVHVGKIAIDGDRATVELEGGDPPRLRKIDGSWKISRLSISAG